MSELSEINKVFKKHHNPIWFNWGTLLGIYRDGKFVDDDIDLACYSLKGNAFALGRQDKITKDLESKGFEIEKYSLGMVVKKGDFRAGIGYYNIDRETRSLIQWNLPVNYLDKFFAKKFYYAFMRKKPTNFMYTFFKLLGGYYITHIIPLDIVCPLRKHRYNGEFFNIPNNPEAYLEYLYGTNWRKPDPTFPHYVSKDNINYWKGTFNKFKVNCKNCGSAFIVDRKHFKKPIQNVKVTCPYCRYKCKEKVFIKGTVQRRIIHEPKIWSPMQ